MQSYSLKNTIDHIPKSKCAQFSRRYLLPYADEDSLVTLPHVPAWPKRAPQERLTG